VRRRLRAPRPWPRHRHFVSSSPFTLPAAPMVPNSVSTGGLIARFAVIVAIAAAAIGSLTKLEALLSASSAEIEDLGFRLTEPLAQFLRGHRAHCTSPRAE
jgi:hypothetical protein